MHLGRYFTLEELKHSNTAQAEGINNDPGPAALAALQALCAAVLDPLREALGKPITVNCAYRGPVLNKRVGGVPNSQHLTGQAADLQSPQASVLDLFKLTISLGLPYDQVIYEARSATSKWLHVSHVDGSNRGEIRVAQFEPDGRPKGYPLVSKAEALAMTERVTRGKALALTYEEGADEPAFAEPAVAARKRPARKKPAAQVATPKPPKAIRKTKRPAVAAPARKAAEKTPAKKIAKAATKKVAKKKVAKKIEKVTSNVTPKAVTKKAVKTAAPKKRATR